MELTQYVITEIDKYFFVEEEINIFFISCYSCSCQKSSTEKQLSFFFFFFPYSSPKEQ